MSDADGMDWPPIPDLGTVAVEPHQKVNTPTVVEALTAHFHGGPLAGQVSRIPEPRVPPEIVSFRRQDDEILICRYLLTGPNHECPEQFCYAADFGVTS